MENILQMLAWRADFITPTGMHYYGIANELIGIGITFASAGWVWVLVLVGIIKKESNLLKRRQLLSQNKIIGISIAMFPICLIIHRYYLYFYGNSLIESIICLAIFVLVISQIIILLFTKKEKKNIIVYNETV